MAPQLVALTEGPDIVLDKPIVLVGRHQECDIQIPSRKISRRHCCLAQVDDHLVIKDLFSTNGIRINDERVPEGILRHGDELTIGNFKYRVEWESSRNGDPPPAPPLPARARPIDSYDSLDQPVALDDSAEEIAPHGLPLVLPVKKPEKKPNLGIIPQK